MNNILILAAHPDDEILGVGGTIQLFKQKKYKIIACQVTDGSSTQYKNIPKLWRQKNQEYKKAMKILRVDEIIKLNFPDMQLDTVPHYQLNEKLNEIINKIKPEMIFTHNETDLNKDHQIIYQATLIATRPTNKFFLRRIYSYEILSSTEWRPGKSFLANTYFNIEKFIEKKKEAFAALKTELRKYPHPRSIEGIEVLAKYRGLESGFKYAEAFKLIKSYEN